MDIVTAKKDLRAALMARRGSIPDGQHRLAATRIAEIGADALSAEGAQTISVFHSFGSEIDTTPLMQALADRGHTLCLPVIVARNEPLIFRRWSPGEPLVAGKFNIQVPSAEAPVILPEVMLVPLLGFDRQGYRIGYGGGFYDRTLALLRSRAPVLAVALAFAAQEIDQVPHADYDQRVNAVLTEEGYRIIQPESG